MLDLMKEKLDSNNKIPRISANLYRADSVNLREVMQKENVLGVIKFSDMEKHDDLNAFVGYFPTMNVAMKPFFGCAYYEVWTSENPVSYGCNEFVQCASDGVHSFLTLSIKEEDRDLLEIGRLAYDSIFETIKKNNYSNISRIWNHIPNINGYTNEKDRYTKFCHGRAESFQKNENIYPAATGIGCGGESLCIYLISTSRNINKYIENPNQTPAYKYPPKYGIKSPSFARAAYADNGSGTGMLYISGTASILGSETANVGDVEKQCETTIDNIRTLISGTNLNSYGIEKNFTLDDIDCIKVYIKNEEDFETIRNICSKAFSNNKSIVYLKADVCRNDLLVEIEGVIKDNDV